jgi:hypothetical protein
MKTSNFVFNSKHETRNSKNTLYAAKTQLKGYNLK